MFKDSFKYYKSKKNPPDLSTVIDFHQPLVLSTVRQIHKIFHMNYNSQLNPRWPQKCKSDQTSFSKDPTAYLPANGRSTSSSNDQVCSSFAIRLHAKVNDIGWQDVCRIIQKLRMQRTLRISAISRKRLWSTGGLFFSQHNPVLLGNTCRIPCAGRLLVTIMIGTPKSTRKVSGIAFQTIWLR